MMFGLPITVIIAISLSYIVAMVVTPVLAAKLYVKKSKKMSKKRKKGYVKLLSKAVHGSLKRPVLVISISFLVLICSLTATILMQPVKLFPSAEDSIIYINYEYTGTLEDKTVEVYAKEIVDVVKAYNDIEYLAYSVGGDLPRFDNSASSLNELPTTGRVYAHFDIPYSRMESLMKDIEEDLEFAQLNGKVSVQELMLGPTSDEIEIILSSKDMDETIKTAEKIEEKLHYIDGIKSYHIAYPNYQKKYIIELDRNKIAQNDTVAIDVQMQMKDYLASTVNGEYIPNGEKMDIVLKTNIDSLEKLASSGIYIQSKTDKLPLDKFGEITSKESLYTVSTKDGDYQITISINAEHGIDSILLQSDIDNEIDDIDSGNVDIAYGGEKELMVESFVELGIAAIVAIILIYVIMLIQFNSFLQPLVVLSTIPLSLIGSGIAAIIFNANISFTVVFGAIALMGIVVNAGILLIDYINKAREQGVGLKKACYKSVERRIRPITLSSVTTIFGLIPLALYGGEFFNPMAITLIGGLATSTLLTIFVIPALYYMIEKRYKKNTKEKTF
ncbi:MAG: efflux RND transporter permease subunit [Clostridiales bacterium]|nr:efflux RND transporter permease subunit [Clostridiales bacterium]